MFFYDIACDNSIALYSWLVYFALSVNGDLPEISEPPQGN